MSAEPTPNPQLPCAICGDPVAPQDPRTDEYGQAVHGECFVETLKQKRQPPSL